MNTNTNIKASKSTHESYSPLGLKPETNKMLDLMEYWAPSIPAWKPLKKKKNSKLQIACIVTDHLFQGLRFEGEVLLLTPENWEITLQYGKPDFLLIESCCQTATGHWHMGQNPGSSYYNELLDVVKLANKLSIPTVYWFTQGHEYHDQFKDFSRKLDYVFCADLKEIELLDAEGISSQELLPCVQSALYNPFRMYNNYNDLDLKILYDGWADLDRMNNELEFLKELIPHGLNIIESRYKIFKNRQKVLPEFKKAIRGCIREQNRPNILRYAKSYVTLDKTLSLPVTQQFMSLEAAACRLPVVHHGTLAESDPRKGIVIESPDKTDFLIEFIRFQEDNLYRDRLAHPGWRKVNQHHTFSHRLQKICREIGINHDWCEYPKVSLITPTYRKELTSHCLETFKKQTYPNKELILVFNGKDVPSLSELGIDENRDDLQVLHMPVDKFAGACLNHGHLHAKGKYCFRVDDDDDYGPNYILDMMLQARSVDADFFGKPPSPLAFEGDSAIYFRDKIPVLCTLSKNDFVPGKAWLGGNSFGGRSEFFKSHSYQNTIYGAADTRLLYDLKDQSKEQLNIAILDNMNLVAQRREDQSSHTWKENKEFLVEKYNLRYNFGDTMI